jgi:hypothetical protein
MSVKCPMIALVDRDLDTLTSAYLLYRSGEISSFSSMFLARAHAYNLDVV